MQYMNKARTAVKSQLKSRKPVVAAAAVAGLMVPAFAVGSPAMAADFCHKAGHTVTAWHLPSLRTAPGHNHPGQNHSGQAEHFGESHLGQAGHPGQNHQSQSRSHPGQAGHPGKITPPAHHGRGGSHPAPTGTPTSNPTTPAPDPTTSTPAPDPTTSTPTPPPSGPPATHHCGGANVGGDAIACLF